MDSPVKIAIIGTAPSSCDVYMDGWQHWGLAYRYLDHVRDGENYLDRAFELHSMEYFKEEGRTPAFFEWIKKPPIPVYVMPNFEAEHGCKIYPVEAALGIIGGPYVTSSIAWMLLQAILEGADEVALLGIDMATDTEYANQRPCIELLIGVCMGRGIKVHVPKESSLLKADFLYGIESPRLDEYSEFLDDRLDKLEALKAEEKDRALITAGRVLECRELAHVHRIGKRGASLASVAKPD